MSAILPQVKAAPSFAYSTAPQGSGEWVDLRVGKPTASRLVDLMATSKRDGKPLKARADYERELAFEREFKTSFSRFKTFAMEQGIQYEQFVKDQYSSLMGVPVLPSGAFYSSLFVASPDGLIGEKGLIEVKVLGDSAYTDVLENGVPHGYYLQVQGQLWASGREWCDFVAANLSTSSFKVIRVERDNKAIEQIKAAVEDYWKSPAKTFNSEGVFTFNAPEAMSIGDEVIFN